MGTGAIIAAGVTLAVLLLLPRWLILTYRGRPRHQNAGYEWQPDLERNVHFNRPGLLGEVQTTVYTSTKSAEQRHEESRQYLKAKKQ
jgi:hypothetical protein